jgi:hypothetical protein
MTFRQKTPSGMEQGQLHHAPHTDSKGICGPFFSPTAKYQIIHMLHERACMAQG